MKNFKINYIKLYKQHMKRNHVFIYGIIFLGIIYAYTMFCFLMLSYLSIIEFTGEPNTLGTFLFAIVYILLFQFVIPFVYGYLNANRLKFPGIGQYLSRKLIEEHFSKETFTAVILQNKNFLESKNWFVFDGVYIPKNLVATIHIYISGRRPTRIYYDILLSTGAVIEAMEIELGKYSSKYKKEFITEYITDYYMKHGYKKEFGDIVNMNDTIKIDLDHYNFESIVNDYQKKLNEAPIREEELWRRIEGTNRDYIYSSS